MTVGKRVLCCFTFVGHWKSHVFNDNNKVILVMLPVGEKAFGQQEGAQ